jgi:hypothetical protein
MYLDIETLLEVLLRISKHVETIEVQIPTTAFIALSLGYT